MMHFAFVDFLGFTHTNSKTKEGKYAVGHMVSKKKKKQFKSKLKAWVKDNRTVDFKMFMKKLNRKLVGTYNYYSVSGAIHEVRNLHYHAMWVVFKWMNRRSQRKSFTEKAFIKVWNEKITSPHIHVNIWNRDGVVYN